MSSPHRMHLSPNTPDNVQTGSFAEGTPGSGNGPDTRCFIRAGRCQVFTIGRPPDDIHAVRVSIAGQERCPLIGIPEMHGAVARSRGDARAIGRPGHALDAVSMAAIGGQRGTCDSIPDLSSFIIADGDDALPIGRPGHARYNADMFEDRKSVV